MLWAIIVLSTRVTLKLGFLLLGEKEEGGKNEGEKAKKENERGRKKEKEKMKATNLLLF